MTLGTIPISPDTRRPRPAATALRTIVTAAGGPVVAAAAYAAASTFVYHRILFASASNLPGCNCGDQAQEVWFLRWPLYAIGHGLNPFFSTWMDYPKGVNLAINTTAPLLGLLSAPLQLTIGTVATYDVLLMLALTLSALAMCLALRRWVGSWGAAFAGGLVYGFSPYMIGQGEGHVFLVALFLPPIVLVLLDDLVVVQRRSARGVGLLLGLVLVLQYFISPEILAMTVVVAACGIALLAAVRRREVLERLVHVAIGLAWAAAVCLVALAYPVWMSLHGPQHVAGPPHSLSGLALFPGDLLGPVLPTSNQLLAPHVLSIHGDALVGGNTSENGMYVGIPLLLVLVALLWAFRRRGALRFFAAMSVVATVLALGPHLVVDTHGTGVPLPAWLLAHLPFFEDILDVRFSLFAQMCVAAALAIGLDELGAAARQRGRRALHASRSSARGSSPTLPRTLLAIGAPLVVAVVALAPLLPATAYPAAPTSTPAFFTSKALDRIPAGSPVLTYPYPLREDAEWNMTFQVVAGMRFKEFGGNAFVPDGPGGTSVPVPTPLAPRVVEHLLSDAYTPALAKLELGTAPGAPTPKVDLRTVSALRTFLGRYHVAAVVVDDLGRHPATVVAYVTDALGPPVKTGGVWAWFDVPHLLARHGPAN